MRILIALDRSELSELALETVAPWLRELGFEAVVATVISDDTIRETYESNSSPYPITPQAESSGTALRVPQATRRVSEDRSQALERARMEAMEYLQACADKYLKDVIAKPVVEWADHAADGILELAGREKADAIVLGTHGRSGVGRLLMGSVAEAVLRRSDVPVIPIRSGMRLAPPEEEIRERG